VAQVIPAGGGGGGFMLLQQAQAGTDDLGLIVEPPTGDKPVDQLLEMWRNDFAYAGDYFRWFETVVNRRPSTMVGCVGKLVMVRDGAFPAGGFVAACAA
jgi:hypothetical protein